MKWPSPTKLSVISWVLSLLGGFWLGYHVLPGCHEMKEVFWTFTSIAVPLCLLLPLGAPRLPWLCPLLTLFAIAAGVRTDAMTDTTMDRNLWGLEALVAQAMAFPGAAIGGAVGSFLSHGTWKKIKTAPPAGAAAGTMAAQP